MWHSPKLQCVCHLSLCLCGLGVCAVVSMPSLRSVGVSLGVSVCAVRQQCVCICRFVCRCVCVCQSVWRTNVTCLKWPSTSEISHRRLTRCSRDLVGFELRRLNVGKPAVKRTEARKFFSDLYTSAAELLPHRYYLRHIQ